MALPACATQRASWTLAGRGGQHTHVPRISLRRGPATQHAHLQADADDMPFCYTHRLWCSTCLALASCCEQAYCHILLCSHYHEACWSVALDYQPHVMLAQHVLFRQKAMHSPSMLSCAANETPGAAPAAAALLICNPLCILPKQNARAPKPCRMSPFSELSSKVTEVPDS